MYDYLGTFTQTQLLERNAFLEAQIHALPNIIESLERELLLLGSSIIPDGSDSYTISTEVGGKSYILGTIPSQTIRPGIALETLTQSAILGRYPLRVDPLTNIISHGDAVWRPDARILTFKDISSDTIDTIPDDDIVPSYRSYNMMKHFRGVSKRQDRTESRIMRLRYRFLRLQDEITDKIYILSEFQNEMAAILKLLNESVEITDSDGQITTEYDYKSAGIDIKTNVTASEDIERLYDLFLAPATADSSVSADQPSTQIVPCVPSTQVSSNIGDPWVAGDITEMLNTFPQVNINIRNRRYLQIIANVYKYGYLTNIMQSFLDDTYLIRNPVGSSGDEFGLRYLPPNVLTDLMTYAQDVYDLYGVRFRVTEAWPPTAMHKSIGHYTGNCVDLVMDLVSINTIANGFTLPDLAQRVIDRGVQKGYIRSGYNEYANESTYKTGDHIHLNMISKYFNEGKLLSG